MKPMKVGAVSFVAVLYFVARHTLPAWCFAGTFGEAGARTDQYVEWLRDYCQVFFYGLTVKLLPAVTVAETGCTFRVNNNSQNLQILTGKFGSPGDWLSYFNANVEKKSLQILN